MKRDLYHWIHRKKLKKKHFINFSGQLTFLGSHEIPRRDGGIFPPFS